MTKNILILILLFWCIDSWAEVNVIVPIATAHITHDGNCDGECNDDYNNENYGLGLSYITGKNEFGAVYINKDSHENENIYFYYGRNYKISRDLTASVSLMLPTGYEALAVVPVWSLKYKMIRVSTTYPVGKVIEQPADVVNVQLVIPLEF